MVFKCPTCGTVFEDILQLANHKRQHQAAPRGTTSGVICLDCGKSIPLEPSKINYSGPLTCPYCHRTMFVLIQGGEVAASRLK